MFIFILCNVRLLFFSDEMLIFSGGMPRASYSDRHTITVQRGQKHVVFDFTSKVIDFFTIDATDDETGMKSLILFFKVAVT